MRASQLRAIGSAILDSATAFARPSLLGSTSWLSAKHIGIAAGFAIGILAVPRLAHSQSYDGTTFVHGLASSGDMWRAPYAGLGGKSVPDFLRQHERLDLGIVRSPTVDPKLLQTGGDRLPVQTLHLRDSLLLGPARTVLVGHSLGGLLSRDAYISHPELRPGIAGIVTVASPHQGADIAYYRVSASEFFTETQKALDGGLRAAKVPSVVAAILGGALVFALTGVAVSWFVPAGAGTGFLAGANLGVYQGLMGALFAVTFLNSQSAPELKEIQSITQIAALKDLVPDNPAYYGDAALDFTQIRRLNARTDDAAIPRASVVADWGNHRHAPLRLFAAARNKEGDAEDLIATRNKGMKLMKGCRMVNRWLFRKRDARRCHRAENMLGAVDEMWARSITGEVVVPQPFMLRELNLTMPVKRPRYGKWDGVVLNSQQRYPGLSDPSRTLTVLGLNHVNVYKHEAGIQKTGEAMLIVGTKRQPPPVTGGTAPPPPPPAPLTVTIDGNAAVRPLAECAYSASVTDGTTPYTYSWTPASSTAGKWLTLGNDGTAFDIVLRVTDAAGREGTAVRTVSVTSTASDCPVAPALD